MLLLMSQQVLQQVLQQVPQQSPLSILSYKPILRFFIAGVALMFRMITHSVCWCYSVYKLMPAVTGE